jgi:hypothetical protein
LPFMALERIEHALLGVNAFAALATYRALFGFLSLTMVGAAAWLTRDVTWVILAYLGARFLQALFGLRHVKKLKAGGPTDPKLQAELVSQAHQMSLYSAFQGMIANVQPVILYNISPLRLANYFGGSKIPDKVKDYAKMLMAAPLQVWLRKGEGHFTDRVAAYGLAYLGGGLVLSTALAAVSPWLVPLVFGEQYRDAVLVAQLLSFTIPPKVAASVLQQREMVHEDTKFYRYTGYAQTLFTLAIMVPLVRTYHEIGLCLVSLISNYLSLGISAGRYWWARKRTITSS